MKTKNKLPIGSFILFGIAVIATAASLIYASGNNASAVRQVNLANRYLAALDYENAGLCYSEALRLDSKNLEAMKGLMITSNELGKTAQLQKTILNYAKTVGKTELSIADEAFLESMVRNVETSFDSKEEYDDFVNKVYKSTKLDNVAEILSGNKLLEAKNLLSEGDYKASLKAMEEFLKSGDKDSLSEEDMKKYYTKVAELAWKNNDFVNAFECIKKVYETDPSDSDVKKYLSIVGEDYIEYCKNNQDYDKAREVIKLLEKSETDPSFADMSKEIASMETLDGKLQTIIENLNSAFKKDDINEITNIMAGPTFISDTKGISNVLYCKSLKESPELTGFGTAIYMVDGIPYVYYGSFTEGKRNGNGLWYTTSNIQGLKKYNLSWLNDLPNGTGQCDEYTNMDYYAEGGVYLRTEVVHTVSNFNANNGILNGTYTKTVDSGTATWNLENGYAPKIMPGDYPEYLTRFMATPATLSAYIYSPFSNSYWWYWTPEQWRVDGLGNLSNLSDWNITSVELF